MSADQRVLGLGYELLPPLKLPPGAVMPFAWVHVQGNRAIISGHLPVEKDGSVYGITGKVGDTVSLEQATEAARVTAFAVLGSLQRTLGSLDRVASWTRVFGMVNTAPNFTQTSQVINGFSEVILDVFGEEIGRHARAAVGMAQLPFGVPVEVEGEVALCTPASS